ncbi:hypothetical protein BPOR_0142g00040 [Botrytis porri]|uniref:FAD-binding domain-containing protein n=1 Tax=Botrytis porri TaxID=87229 RepID=A0A4Z1KW87_9HELO|nr:hypothetical protein BPOR_0142g00040 [Botrytis porri]
MTTVGCSISLMTPPKANLLRIATGIPDLEIDIKSILPWEPSVRVADQLQHGNIFLAGDAAHQMPYREVRVQTLVLQTFIILLGNSHWYFKKKQARNY